MGADDLSRHVAQLDALAHDLAVLGLHAEVEIQSGRRGRWLVTPGEGVRTISSVHRWWQHNLDNMHMVRLGCDVLHLTTSDLQSVVVAAADLAVHGRWVLDVSGGVAGEFCLTPERPILMRHPTLPGLWWFAPDGELAALGRLESATGRAGTVDARR
ncbi:hypothetical protein [Aeromicrobium fastidiosum]|uniref:Uncharacterized protein n=1 Tax=Aeromicrobium fastidiosum TaxID=52699 RepID=A0A641ATX1_9ACTN|nr:hypothetical protein [Aeromicrobium fastidiosum]KAA1380481.1 hypothetical protein ESP62_004695 [Aeromicrobium fastidiosum]MBP2390070.1 hypothetical protein [Aeromicrobium fastidiosum]